MWKNATICKLCQILSWKSRCTEQNLKTFDNTLQTHNAFYTLCYLKNISYPTSGLGPALDFHPEVANELIILLMSCSINKPFSSRILHCVLRFFTKYDVLP